jgi:hypothetical protein
MKSATRWKVVTADGHELETKLQQLSDSGYEILSVDRADARWTIIAHTADNSEPKGKTIGFRPPEK